MQSASDSAPILQRHQMGEMRSAVLSYSCMHGGMRWLRSGITLAGPANIVGVITYDNDIVSLPKPAMGMDGSGRKEGSRSRIASFCRHRSRHRRSCLHDGRTNSILCKCQLDAREGELVEQQAQSEWTGSKLGMAD